MNPLLDFNFFFMTKVPMNPYLAMLKGKPRKGLFLGFNLVKYQSAFLLTVGQILAQSVQQFSLVQVLVRLDVNQPRLS